MTDTDIILTYKTFLENIISIKNVSDDMNDAWELLGDKNEEGGCYLRKKVINSNLLSLSSSTDDNSFQIIVYEYHVTYNVSYGTPMLCLNIYSSDGKYLTLEQAWKLCDSRYTRDNMYSTLTQQDHPVLQKPFLVLHPCKTSEIMEHFINKSNNLVVSWLSTISPIVNLKLDNVYEKLTKIINKN